MAANSELMETIVNQDSVLTQMRRDHRFDLQQCLRTITAGGKREAALKGEIEAANKKTERAHKKSSSVDKAKRDRDRKTETFRGEDGEVGAGKEHAYEQGAGHCKGRT